LIRRKAMKRVEVLGPGCAKCEKLYQRVEEAIRELAVECELQKVVDISRIVEAGVLMTPALVVDGEIKLSGRVPDTDELKALLA
jgi:small redox-active disulfide protein 2